MIFRTPAELLPDHSADRPLHVACHPDDEAVLRERIASSVPLHVGTSVAVRRGQAYVFSGPIPTLGCPECAPPAAPGPPQTADGG